MERTPILTAKAPVACRFVNTCQIIGVSRTCFHCILKVAILDITGNRLKVIQTGLLQTGLQHDTKTLT